MWTVLGVFCYKVTSKIKIISKTVMVVGAKKKVLPKSRYEVLSLIALYID